MAVDLTRAKQNVNNAELAIPTILAALEDLEERLAELEDAD